MRLFLKFFLCSLFILCHVVHGVSILLFPLTFQLVSAEGSPCWFHQRAKGVLPPHCSQMLNQYSSVHNEPLERHLAFQGWKTSKLIKPQTVQKMDVATVMSSVSFGECILEPRHWMKWGEAWDVVRHNKWPPPPTPTQMCFLIKGFLWQWAALGSTNIVNSTPCDILHPKALAKHANSSDTVTSLPSGSYRSPGIW